MATLSPEQQQALNDIVALDPHQDGGALLDGVTGGGKTEVFFEAVDFALLSTTALNARKMLGPDQYQFDAMGRAQSFVERVSHEAAARRARAIG